MLLSLFTAKASHIVADYDTHLPISNASIYTENAGKAKGTHSNDKGEFIVNFPFSKLSFSHINYEKLELSYSELYDTIFLQPKCQLLSEITVSNNNQAWYRSLLRKVVKNKKNVYRKKKTPLSYKYTESTLTDSGLYNFSSSGSILIMPLKEENNFKIAPTLGSVKYRDSTANSNYRHLGRTVYNDLLRRFNNSFIKESIFAINSDFESNDPNLAMIGYKSTTDYKREGYIIIDTANYILKEMTEQCDTKYNLKIHSTPFLLSLLKTLGVQCHKWETIINAKYDKLGDSYQMIECNFQISLVDEFEDIKTEKRLTYHTNAQSQIIFENNANKNPTWILLPRNNHMALMHKKDLRAYDALQKLPVEHLK